MNECVQSLSLHEHSHVPYPILIMQYLQQWQDGHAGALPTSYPERKEVKALIEQGVRARKDGLGPEDEQNFSEAQAACNTALLPPEVCRVCIVQTKAVVHAWQSSRHFMDG